MEAVLCDASRHMETFAENNVQLWNSVIRECVFACDPGWDSVHTQGGAPAIDTINSLVRVVRLYLRTRGRDSIRNHCSQNQVYLKRFMKSAFDMLRILVKNICRYISRRKLRDASPDDFVVYLLQPEPDGVVRSSGRRIGCVRDIRITNMGVIDLRRILCQEAQFKPLQV